MQTANIEFAPTQNCNLGCTYCYVDRTSKKMSVETADLFFKNLDTFLGIYHTPYYNISYFGGEPTLNWPIIKYTLPKFRDDLRCQQTVLISNLLNIDEDDAEYIQKNNLGVSWSFDGLWNSGDNRPLVSGESSLPTYMKKIELLKTVSCGNVKVMVGPQNVNTMTENLKFFVEDLGISNPDYTLVRDDVWSQENIDDFAVEIVKLADQHIEYLKDGLFSLGFFSLTLLDLYAGGLYPKRPFSCFAGCNGSAFLPDGIFYPCMRFGSSKRYPLLNANTGEVYSQNIETLLNPKFHNPRTFEKCKQCSLYKYCNSGCHYSQMRMDEDGKPYGEPIDSVCQLFYILYKQTFRIFEVLKDNSNFQKTIYNYLQQRFKGAL